MCMCVFSLHCVASNDNLCCSVPPVCPAADSVVVLQEGAGLPAAHTPSDWLESEEFGPVTSDPIFMAADTKTPPPGTLSRVSCCSCRLIELIFCSVAEVRRFRCCFVLLIRLANLRDGAVFRVSLHQIRSDGTAATLLMPTCARLQPACPNQQHSQYFLASLAVTNLII